MLAVGAAKAREQAAPTLATMYDRMGFVLPGHSSMTDPAGERR